MDRAEMAMSGMVRARFASMRRKRDRATDGCPGADSLPPVGVSRRREPPSFVDRTRRPVYDQNGSRRLPVQT